jgi:hypothetical protein
VVAEITLLKEAVRERDNLRCVDCGMTQEEHKKQYGMFLHVHRHLESGREGYTMATRLGVSSTEAGSEHNAPERRSVMSEVILQNPRGWVYLRTSSKSQRGSVERQREEVQKLADREGIEILAEYIDQGKGAEFHRLLTDAQCSQPGDVDYVLACDRSRFGRQSPIDSALAQSILHDKGIRLWTVQEGVLDL